MSYSTLLSHVETNLCAVTSSIYALCLGLAVCMPEELVLPSEDNLRNWFHTVMETKKIVGFPNGSKLVGGATLPTFDGIRANLKHITHFCLADSMALLKMISNAATATFPSSDATTAGSTNASLSAAASATATVTAATTTTTTTAAATTTTTTTAPASITTAAKELACCTESAAVTESNATTTTTLSPAASINTADVKSAASETNTTATKTTAPLDSASITVTAAKKKSHKRKSELIGLGDGGFVLNI